MSFLLSQGAVFVQNRTGIRAYPATPFIYVTDSNKQSLMKAVVFDNIFSYLSKYISSSIVLFSGFDCYPYTCKHLSIYLYIYIHIFSVFLFSGFGEVDAKPVKKE